MLMFCAGGKDSIIGPLDNILQFDGETQQWVEVGQLRQKRYSHASSVINITQIDAYINCD